MSSKTQAQNVLSTLIEQEQAGGARDNVFFICEWTNQQYELGNFAVVDELLADIDVAQFGEDTLVALMTFTLCVSDLLPHRKSFVKSTFDYLEQIIGKEIERLRELE